MTWNQCINLFLQNHEAKGFTYYESNHDRLSNVCILFEKLKNKHECKTCISAKKAESDENCICNQQEGECEINGENIITGAHAKSEFECFLQCATHNECEFYNWFSKENENVKEECFLFSSCQTIKVNIQFQGL